ncbi:hypothetical protein A1122_19890 [Yersinia pestis A1122]|nr:hypothetical protein A1122_19890 [Yersinia pestis A1122]EKS46877.1 hypothetical protein INS_06205 [Yersinia pestis INS]
MNTEPLAHIDNSDQGEPLVAPLIAIDSIINPFGEQKESVVPSSVTTAESNGRKSYQ